MTKANVPMDQLVLIPLEPALCVIQYMIECICGLSQVSQSSRTLVEQQQQRKQLLGWHMAHLDLVSLHHDSLQLLLQVLQALTAPPRSIPAGSALSSKCSM